MSKVLLYIPEESITDQECWNDIRQWVRTSGLTWDKIRCTPAAIQKASVKQDEIKAALGLLRQGTFERVVFAKLPENYDSNLDWLMFAISCQAQSVTLETLEGAITLPPSAQKLAAHYNTLATKKPVSSSAPERLKSPSL